MRASIVASLLTLAASVSALQITYPTGTNASVDLSQENTLTWTSSPNDPKTAKLELVNMSVNPSVQVTIAEKVDTTTQKYAVQPQTNLTLGANYQFRLVGAEGQNTGILSLSPQFSVTKVAEKKADETKTTATPSTPAQSSAAAAASTTAAGSGAGKVGAWGVGGLLVAGAFAALL